MHGNHVNNIQEQKPIKQNWLKTIDFNKNPKIPRFKIFNKKHQNAWRLWFQWKKRLRKTLLNFEKFEEENDKKGLDWIAQRRTVGKLLKMFEKCEEHGRKTSFKTILTKFWSVENKSRLIEKQIWWVQH